MSNHSPARSRNDILRDTLTDEAEAMLTAGAALDHILAILPESVGVGKFQQLLYDRAVAWVLKNMEANDDIYSYSAVPHTIRLESWEKLQRCMDNFWDELSNADYIRLAIHPDPSFEDIKNQFLAMMDSGILYERLGSDAVAEVSGNVVSILRLSPRFDYDTAITANHGYLVDLWNELA